MKILCFYVVLVLIKLNIIWRLKVSESLYYTKVTEREKIVTVYYNINNIALTSWMCMDDRRKSFWYFTMVFFITIWISQSWLTNIQFHCMHMHAINMQVRNNTLFFIGSLWFITCQNVISQYCGNKYWFNYWCLKRVWKNADHLMKMLLSIILLNSINLWLFLSIFL